ncbi:unnamed protein product [Closterium sp. Naga37s-1]|nr:unnamed protein product [Closterium sp. Naga37s-1]
MGGHGGLNILPQKRWNVYNYENREKVRKDEAEEAAREQALAEEQRLRDSELRLQTLRARARQQHLPLPQQQAAEEHLLPPQDQAAQPSAEDAVVVADSSRLAESLAISTRDSVSQAGALNAGHINLFEGLDSADFSALPCSAGAQSSDAVRPGRAQEVWEKEHKAGEEEKHRLGYGAVGKGGQQPWYARAGDLTVGEGEGQAGKTKEDAGSRGVGKRRIVEVPEAKTDSQKVAFEAPHKLDSQRVTKIKPGEGIHRATDEDRDDNDDKDIIAEDGNEHVSIPRHKKKRKRERRRSASPHSSSSTSLASSDDDANHHRCRSRKHWKKHHGKRQFSSSGRSSSQGSSSSSLDSDSDRRVRKKQGSRHSARDRSGERGGQRRRKEHDVGKRQVRETRRALGASGGRKTRNERGTERKKGKEGVATEERMRCESGGAAAEHGKMSIEALRAERVAREARERERAQILLLQHHQTTGGRGLGGVVGSVAAGVGNASGVRELGGGVEGNGLFGGIVMHGPETGQRRKEARYNSGFGYGR